MCAPRSVVAHGVLVSVQSLRVAYTPPPLADDLGCRRVHGNIVIVPFVGLCQVAVHVLE